MRRLFTCAPDRLDFLGACLDTGAARSHVGHSQARAYTRLIGTFTLAKKTTPAKFIFWGTVTPSLGTSKMRVPIAPTIYANLFIEAVHAAVPFLMGSNALEALATTLKDVDNTLKCDKRGTATALKRKDSHIYQPAIRKASTRTATSAQSHAGAPGRLCVALPPGDMVFNRTVLIDLIYWDGRSLLYAVEKDSLYSATSFCRGQSHEDLWQRFLTLWVHAYASHPQVMHTDQAPPFQSAAWEALTDSASTELVHSGIESHNALGVGERYHSFLRPIYRKVWLAHPTLSQEMALSTATATMNQAPGARGLIPTLLIFWD